MASRIVSILAAGCFVGLGVGCATGGPRGDPPSSTASKREVLDAALRLEERAEGRSASFGAGDSMAPIYGENSVIVTHPIGFDELEAGMIVEFISETHGRVVHQLTRKTRHGWKSKGINNPVEDAGHVTADNLIGVVYGVFQSSGGEPE